VRCPFKLRRPRSTRPEPVIGFEPTPSALRKRPLTIRVHWHRAVGRHRTGTLRLTEAALSHLSFNGKWPALPIERPGAQPPSVREGSSDLATY